MRKTMGWNPSLVNLVLVMLLNISWSNVTSEQGSAAMSTSSVPSPTLPTLSARNVTVGVEGFSTKAFSPLNGSPSTPAPKEGHQGKGDLAQGEEVESEDSPSPLLTAFSPEEVAEYIFLTGDESRVASVIEEESQFLDVEMMLNFLEETRAHLAGLREKYRSYLDKEKATPDLDATAGPKR